MPNIKMYGTPTCKDCIIAKQVFKELGTSYEFININNDPEATKTAVELNNRVRRIPQNKFAHGSVIEQPSHQQLKTRMSSD